MINRFFNPDIYKSQGYNDFISVTESKFDLIEGKQTQQILYLTKNSIGYYDFKYLDTSQISVIDLGTSF